MPLAVRRLLRAVAGSTLLAACGGGGPSGEFAGPVGRELDKPGGGTFFLDFHHFGHASRIHLLECTWGRLVDVHDLDAAGEVHAEPVFRDLVINETVQTDGLNYHLETNPITQGTRLVVLRRRGEVVAGRETFEELLARARANPAPIVPKPDDGSVGGPFSLVIRNACLSLRFDDLLADDFESRLALQETVRILTGYPARSPFQARIFFDPNHGGLVGGEFHSTRVLIDTAVSEQEAAVAEFPLLVNPIGLPSSALEDPRPSAALRIASRPDPGSGRFRVLTGLGGAPMDRGANGPVDQESPSLEVVRAFRAGRASDANSGFLLDLNPPELVGRFPLSIRASFPLPTEPAGFDFTLDLLFPGACRRAPRPADIVQVGEFFLEVRQQGALPNVDGEVSDVRVRLVGTEPLENAARLLGGAAYLTTYTGGLQIPFACWASVLPIPGVPPDRALAPGSQFVARFSEPMSPESVDPFESLRLVRGNTGTPLLASTLVVAQVGSSPDLRSFTLRPVLPLAPGQTGEYHLELLGGPDGLRDLAGNPIAAVPGSLEYQLDAGLEVPENGGLVLRFGAQDELEPVGLPDLRGQVLYDFSDGTIRGREVTLESFAADQSQPVPGIMIPFGPGVQTPLSGLGSKLQFLWRYCDLGWSPEDETKHNLDVIGLAWAPVGGTVLNDFFPRFEMRLSHSERLPDEFRTFVGTEFPCSGLGAGANICPPCLTNVPFQNNVLVDPLSPQRIVHERSLGYRIESRDLFSGRSGKILMPYPMNRGAGPFTSFTWRDTAVLARGGRDSGGIPLKIEVAAPLNIVPGPPGRIALGGLVPAWGLPLLIEVRCFPSSTALGLNPLEIYLAQNAQSLPNFRAFSTGGTNESGIAVQVDPDLAFSPEGGFNPRSRPPGMPTLNQADNSFYVGQLETVVRVSRAHTAWFEVSLTEPHFLLPVTSPRADRQPGDSRVEIDFRGANGFTGLDAERGFDARELDPLGDISPGTVQFRGDALWHADPAQLDGARYLQLRISFVNDIVARVTPRLSAIGLAFTKR